MAIPATFCIRIDPRKLRAHIYGSDEVWIYIHNVKWSSADSSKLKLQARAWDCIARLGFEHVRPRGGFQAWRKRGLAVT